MDLWYGHSMTVVYFVTVVVEAHVDYALRGWTLFERSAAELMKPASAPDDGYPMCVDLSADDHKGRTAPLVPIKFAEELAKRKFTNGNDAATVVELYTKMAVGMLWWVERLMFELPSGSGSLLGMSLNLCRSLEILLE